MEARDRRGTAPLRMVGPVCREQPGIVGQLDTVRPLDTAESPVLETRRPGRCRGREIDALYTRYAVELQLLVRGNLTLGDDVLDDACQFAWESLVFTRTPPAAGSELAWLATTATREALRLLRLRRSESNFSEFSGVDADRGIGARVEGSRSARRRSARALSAVPASEASDPAQLAELHDRLADIGYLSPRQQQIVWLHGFGYDYNEISAATGASPRTVQRQLMKARRKLRG